MKIRGIKRKIKSIDRWRFTNQKLPIIELQQNLFCYRKLDIKPWYRLNKVRPSKSVRLEMTKALCEVCLNWKKELESKGYENFYLAIWIDVDQFVNSQVVCAIKSKMNYYASAFDNDGLNEFNFSNVTEFPDQFMWKLHEERESTSFDDYVGSVDDYELIGDFLSNKALYEKNIRKSTTFHKIVDGIDVYSFLVGRKVVGFPL